MPISTKCDNCGRPFEYDPSYNTHQLKMVFMNFKNFCCDRCLQEYQRNHGGKDTSAGKGFLGLW